MVIILYYPIFNFSDILEDAERINIKQTKRIKTLERDLKAAYPQRGGNVGKKEPLIEAVETVQPRSESKQTIVCQSFSDDNENVIVSNDKRSVKYNGGPFDYGYCFLKHPKMQKNQILKWNLRVPKFKFPGSLGMVIMPE